MTWPSPIVCQSLDLGKETFRCDSCFPYKVHFLYFKDIWFAWPKYVQINLLLKSSLARPAQLSVVFEVNTIHRSNFQSTSLVSRKKKGYLDLRGEKIQSPWKMAWKQGVIPAEACGLQDDVTLLCLASSTTPRRRNLLTALAQCTVSHFRSSSTKSSSWFLSSLVSLWQRDNVTTLF